MKKKILVINIMTNIYGGGIPFSSVLKVRDKTKKRSTRRIKKKRSKTKRKRITRMGRTPLKARCNC